MIKPSDILYRTKALNGGFDLKISTPKGLGRGGFAFSYYASAMIDDIGVHIELQGNFVDTFGPLKNDFECYIDFLVEPPFDWKDKENQVEAYKYCYSHKESLRGQLTSGNVKEICVKLMKKASDYFEYNTEYFHIGDYDNYTECKVQFYNQRTKIITRQL